VRKIEARFEFICIIFLHLTSGFKKAHLQLIVFSQKFFEQKAKETRKPNILFAYLLPI